MPFNRIVVADGLRCWSVGGWKVSDPEKGPRTRTRGGRIGVSQEGDGNLALDAAHDLIRANTCLVLTERLREPSPTTAAGRS